VTSSNRIGVDAQEDIIKPRQLKSVIHWQRLQGLPEKGSVVPYRGASRGVQGLCLCSPERGRSRKEGSLSRDVSASMRW